MSPGLNRLLVRLGRWPRRTAAALCLVLAVSSAVQSHASARAPAAPSPLSRLGPGQIAVPVSLDQPASGDVLQAGARVGLVSTSGLLADGLLVLSVQAGSADSDTGQSILVATDRSTAVRIARISDPHILAVLDKSP